MMEPLPEADVPLVFGEMKRIAAKLVLVSVSYIPASYAVDGRNLHETVQPESWWMARMEAAIGSPVSAVQIGRVRCLTARIP